MKQEKRWGAEFVRGNFGGREKVGKCSNRVL